MKRVAVPMGGTVVDIASSEVLDSLVDGVVVVGADRSVLTANAAAASLLRTPLDQLVGAAVADLPWTARTAGGTTPAPAAASPGDGWAVAAISVDPMRDGLVELSWPDDVVRWFRVNVCPVARPTGAVVVSFREVTEQRAVVARLRLQARLLDAVGDAVIATDLDGKLVYGNPAAQALFGLDGDDVRGRPMADLMARVVVGGDVDELRAHVRDAGAWRGSLEIRRPDGAARSIVVSTAAYFDDDGSRLGVLGVIADVSDRRLAAEAARTRASLQAALVDLGHRALQPGDLDLLLRDATVAVGDALVADRVELVLLDAEGDRLVRRAGTGWEPGAVGPDVEAGDYAEVMLEADGPVILPDDPTTGLRAELGVASSLLAPLDGRRGPVGAIGVHTGTLRVFSGDEVHFVQAVAAVLVAAIQRDEDDAELQRMARHDALTGLPNRALFLERTEAALARARRTEVPVAVLFADLDGFKVVNDRHGHDAGDRLLVLVAERLVSAVRPFDVVARHGGDEFAVLCEEVPGRREAELLAERVHAALVLPFDLGAAEVSVTSSIGVVLGGGVRDSPESMLRDADVAMYRAKERGRARHEVFDDRMRVEARLRLDLHRDLRHALRLGHLRLEYQPSIDLRAGAPAARSVEALLRWDHPEIGAVPAAQVIGIAEESGLIVPLGMWVLEEACRQVAAWEADAGEAITVAVNLSSHHFGRPELRRTVADVLQRTGLAPERLILEVTESAVMHDPEAAIATMQELKDLGVGLAIDDFGTGYSSLAYLKRFPVDALKVDRSFVGGSGRDLEDRTIAGAVVGLAHSLGLTAVAEGVETPRQLDELRSLGCDTAQGFLWSRALRPAELLEWVRSQPPAD